MDAAVKLKSKHLYKIELWLIKIIPFVLAIVCFVNTTLSYLRIDIPFLSYLGSTALLPLIFLYVSSYVFKFCEYHRMFLHYIVVNDILSWIDYSYGLPFDNLEYLVLHMSIAGIFLFIILYLKQKHGISIETCYSSCRGEIEGP